MFTCTMSVGDVGSKNFGLQNVFYRKTTQTKSSKPPQKRLFNKEQKSISASEFFPLSGKSKNCLREIVGKK